MTNKELYKELCETEGSKIPLFLQYWWMETVCVGKHWDVILVRDRQGKVVAAMPYLIGSKMGLRYVLQPQLTQYNGPWYDPHAGIPVSELDRELIAELNNLHLLLFQQNFSPSVSNLEAWKDYRVSARRTYRIEDISNPQQVFEHFDKSRRQRQIRRAEKVLALVEDLTPERFAQFHNEYWQSKGEKDLLSHDFIVRVVSQALQRGQGVLLGLKDDKEVLRAARFVAFDSDSAYALLSALHPEQHPNGASAMLFWLIIQRLSKHTRSFDFEGSMDAKIAYSYSLYGAKPVTYYQVRRVRPLCIIPKLSAL